MTGRMAINKKRRTAKVSSSISAVAGKKRDREGEEAEEGNDISQYELQRLERIKRNNAFMASLSLDSLNKVCGSPTRQIQQGCSIRAKKMRFKFC